MSLKTNKENFYFLPSRNKNSLNLYSVENLFQDDFEIMVKVEVDWDKFLSGEEVGGIVSKNGQHMGIFSFKNWLDQTCEYIIMAKIWTVENDEITMKDLTFKVGEALLPGSTEKRPDYIYNIKLSHNLKDKKIIFTCDDNIQEYEYTGKIRDYTDSMLWYGCGMGIGDEWNQSFCGEFLESYISVKDGYKIFESDFTQLTDYKVFDQSWNGNHLVKFDEVNII